MRFRKSIKIAPGLKVNVSKSGVSGTVGVKGASVNVGKNGAYLNTGIPGTGIYNREKISGAAPGAEADTAETETGGGAKLTALATFGGMLVLGGLIFLIGYFAAGSFWLKKVIAAIVLILGIILCVKGGNKPAADQPAEPPASAETDS